MYKLLEGQNHLPCSMIIESGHFQSIMSLFISAGEEMKSFIKRAQEMKSCQHLTYQTILLIQNINDILIIIAEY